MNGLKAINDEHGHDAGDAAIAEFRNAVRSEHKGKLFRTGGDEFVIFELGLTDNTISLAKQLLKTIGAGTVKGQRLSASIGIALARDPLEDPQAILVRADQEMYRAKKVSRESISRRCTLAVEGSEVLIIAT